MTRRKLHIPAVAGYEESMSPYHAAARHWLDAVINPLDTRRWISMGIEAASQSPATREFNMGVLQDRPRSIWRDSPRCIVQCGRTGPRRG